MLSTREKFNTLLNMALVKSTFLGGGDANMHDFVRFTAPISYDLTTIFRNKITVGFLKAYSVSQ
jgi:hypothetical protein